MRANAQLDNPTGSVVQRAAWWSLLFSEILLATPELWDQIPQDADVMVQPVSDPEVCEHNRNLMRSATGKFIIVDIEEKNTHLVVQPYQPGKSVLYQKHVA
jgi:hypothetical protein